MVTARALKVTMASDHDTAPASTRTTTREAPPSNSIMIVLPM